MREKIYSVGKLLGIFMGMLIFFPGLVNAAPVISTLSDNRASYPSSQIPTFEKFEITFSVSQTTATNFFFPFDANPPPAVTPGIGISVNGVFTDPAGVIFTQPAFYYEDFDYQVKNNKEWFYPTSNYSWKIRFSPNKAGTWKYKISAIDAGGTAHSSETTFTVSDSNNKGFVKIAAQDTRYFEFDNGTYFPGLGYNLPEGVLDNINPERGNQAKLQAMSTNGMDLSRVWVTMYSIYGEAYAKWGSSNKAHQTQEPRYGIVSPVSALLTSTFATFYPGQTPPPTPTGSEYYLWLEYNKSITPGQPPELSLQRFTPCRFQQNIAVKQNTPYRVRAHFRAMNLEGPLDTTKPFGFAIKRSPNELANPIDACNDPRTSGVTTIAASYNTTQVQNDMVNPNWKYLEGTYNSGTNDFLGYLYLTFDNVKSTDSDPVAGHVFIDKVWLEEASCTANCLNLLSKSSMDMHTYISQPDAYNFDKFLELAKQYNMYIKAVMNEKNDRILQTIDYNGQLAATPSTENFYGNGTTITRVRWLQQAWWRYIQARWGYSPNIHSWELMNEGAATANHYAQADEFGKFMHCRVFGQQPTLDATIGNICRFDHPNAHLVTTSFSGSVYPWQFWNNGGNAAGYKLYRDIDYADQHYYANADDTSALASFYDSALFSYTLSTAANFAPNTRKPLIRGETAWNEPAASLFATNTEGGEWLHDFLWAGLNSGGLMEHFFAGGQLTKQIFDLRANPPFDHRPMFKTFSDFIRNIPLNNGNYQDSGALVSSPEIRAWGQKDTANKRAHLWIANKNHTWKSVIDHITIQPINATVSLPGFTPNTAVSIEWWNTYTGTISQTLTQNTNASGQLVLTVSNLTTDTAVKIGDYGGSPTVSTATPTRATSIPGDLNNDNHIDIFDFNILLGEFGRTGNPGFISADINRDGSIDIFDYNILLQNFGR